MKFLYIAILILALAPSTRAEDIQSEVQDVTQTILKMVDSNLDEIIAAQANAPSEPIDQLVEFKRPFDLQFDSKLIEKIWNRVEERKLGNGFSYIFTYSDRTRITMTVDNRADLFIGRASDLTRRLPTKKARMKMELNYLSEQEKNLLVSEVLVLKALLEALAGSGVDPLEIKIVRSIDPVYDGIYLTEVKKVLESLQISKPVPLKIKFLNGILVEFVSHPGERRIEVTEKEKRGPKIFRRETRYSYSFDVKRAVNPIEF